MLEFEAVNAASIKIKIIIVRIFQATVFYKIAIKMINFRYQNEA